MPVSNVLIKSLYVNVAVINISVFTMEMAVLLSF